MDNDLCSKEMDMSKRECPVHHDNVCDQIKLHFSLCIVQYVITNCVSNIGRTARIVNQTQLTHCVRN